MELSSCHLSGTKYLEMAPRFLQNLWTHDLVPITVFLVVLVFKVIKQRGANKIQGNSLKMSPFNKFSLLTCHDNLV
jgi:hypothetical protein